MSRNKIGADKSWAEVKVLDETVYNLKTREQ